jgi:thymidylate kinase
MNLKEYDIAIKQSLADCGVVHLRGEMTTDADLDFYVSRKDIDIVITNLKKEQFYLASKDDDKLLFQKIIGRDVIKIDLALGFDYIFRKVPGISFQQKFLESYLENPAEYEVDFNAVRYLFMERKQEKYLSYLKNNRREIISRDLFKKSLASIPFKTNVSSKSIINRLDHSKRVRVFPFLKFKHQFRYLLYHLRVATSIMGSGRSVAVIGPDGCGKSTMVEFLDRMPGTKSIYMGSNYYILGNVYSKISKNSYLLFRAAKFFAIYIENWLKIGRILTWKIRGKTVYIDRYPSYQYFLTEKRKKWILNLLYYRLFPKPDITMVLFCSEKTILCRKNELTASEIHKTYEALSESLKNLKNVFWIQSENLNESIGQLLDLVRKHASR